MTAVDNITRLRPRHKAIVRQDAEAENWSGPRLRRVSVVVGVAGLVAMAMLTLLVGRFTPDTRSLTTVIAAPQTTRNSPSASPTVHSPPFSGNWIGNNWYDSHKGE